MKRLNRSWIFSDNIRGHELQSVTLAEMLSIEFYKFNFKIRQPWRLLTPKILWGFSKSLEWIKTSPDVNQLPDVIITCGRKAAAVGRFFSKKHQIPQVQILNPGNGMSNYKVLILPKHDQQTAANIVQILGGLHPYSTAYLENLSLKWRCVIKKDKNNAAIFLGDPDKEALLAELDQLIKPSSLENTNFHIVGSRRTPDKIKIEIKKKYSNLLSLWFDSKDGENPYLKLLSCADELYVSADSINMVSEACATQKPVYLMARERIKPKHKRFIESISERWLELGQKPNDTKYQPILNLEAVAKQVLSVLESD